jgi:phage/plasmid-like protein (TIGR03299 family)
MSIDPNNRVQDILNKTNLNWKVRTETVQTESGIILDDHRALIRDDTNKVLSIRSDSYQPYQNEELVELLERVSDMSGYEIRSGGHFGDGKKVYIQLKSDNLILGNDVVEGYLTGVNSFDGSTSLAFGPSNVTISCQNTFFASFREIKTRVRHTKNMKIQIDEICLRLENAKREEKKIFDKIVRFSETPFDDVLKQKVTKALFDIDPKLNLNKVDDYEQISTRTQNNLSRFYIDLNGELKEKGENMWGLFSGITKYTTHSLKGEMMENKMFGMYGKRELGIFNHMTELV